MARLTYTQVAPLLKSVYEQVTGRSAQANVNFGQMQSVFTTALANNSDNLYGAIPTVLAKTVYASRPYRRKFRGAFWDEQMYGDWTRKFTPIVTSYEDNAEWNINPELAKKASEQDWKAGTAPNVYDFLHTVTTGGNTYSRKHTILRNQLNAAFESEQGVADFWSMMLTEWSNQFEVDGENEIRSQLANIIIALADANKETPTTGNACRKEQVFHAISEYNTETGLALTAQTVMQPDNFKSFMIWFSAKLDYLKEMLGNHDVMYHANITGKDVNRHTDKSNMRMYISAQFAKMFEANGATLYHPDKLELGDYEEVSYWQSPDAPATVKGSATGLKTDGTALTIANSTVSNIVALITDKDMFGIVPINNWAASEPYNARFGFVNSWYHYTWRQQTDFTEKALLILFD